MMQARKTSTFGLFAVGGRIASWPGMIHKSAIVSIRCLVKFALQLICYQVQERKGERRVLVAKLLEAGLAQRVNLTVR